MFTNAKEWDLLEKNIMENVKPPAVLKNEAKIYENDKDILDMIVALLKEPLQKQILFLTAMSASMRRGELIGLDFNNIFFDKNEIKICQSAANTKEGPIIKSTKNKRTRIVAIPPILTEMYQQLLKERKELKLMLGENWEGSSDIDRSAVFIQKNGKRMYPSSPTQIWNKFLKKHKLKKITLHQLRHTSASVMLHEEIDIQTVSSILGHSRASTTAEIYLHLFGNGKAAAANIFENKIQNAKKLG